MGNRFICYTFDQHTIYQAMQLSKEILNDPTAVERLFCEPFEKLPTRKLNKAEAELVFNMVKCETAGKEVPLFKTQEEFDKLPIKVQFAYNTLKNNFTYTIPNDGLLLICVASEGLFGILMFLTYLQYRAKRLNKPNLTSNDFIDVFPSGIPLQEHLDALWDALTIIHNENRQVNLLTYKEALAPLQFKKENEKA